MKCFEEPKLDVETFEAVDIITTSGEGCQDFGGSVACPFDD